MQLICPEVYKNRTYALKARIKNILQDLERDGIFQECPNWLSFKNYSTGCSNCRAMFPKTKDSDQCPCDVYTSKYLIQRLKYILKRLTYG